MNQRYISKELTHFVGGKSENDNKRYGILKTIMSDELLSHPPHDKNQSGNLTILSDLSFCDNTMYNLESICFCDIPVEDFEIHIKKYSGFGISFLKSFLIKNGANPVFYIANNSMRHEKRNYDIWNDMIHVYNNIVRKCINEPRDPPDQQKVRAFQSFIHFNVFGYMKPFDDSLPEDDADNYYMEREWRIIGNLNFKLQDVYRVILPQLYVKQFKSDFPGYCGQITFSD